MLEQKHLDNLTKLANYVESHVTDEQFSMDKLRQDAEGKSVYFESSNHCGTKGCLLGWAPFAIEPDKDHFAELTGLLDDETESIESYKVLSFLRYSREVFGIVSSSREWDYLFAGGWHGEPKVVSERLDAVARIRKLVSEGRTP